MNDQIKLLIAGAVIGIAGAVAGGLVVGWAVGKDEGRKSKVETRATTYRSQPVSPFASSKLNPTTPRPGGGAGITPPMTSASSAAFQKARDTPEVKKAREEYLESQKRYMEAMKKAVGSVEKPVPSVGGRVTSDGKAGQATVGSGQAVKK